MSLTLHLLVIVPRGVNLSEPCPRRHRAARRPPPAASLWRCDSYLTAVFAGKQIKFTGDVWPQDLSARGASLAPCAHPPCPPGPSGANLYLTVTPGLTAGRWLGGGQRLCVNPASWSRAPDPHVPPHCLVFVMLWIMTWNQRDVSRRWSNSGLMCVSALNQHWISVSFLQGYLQYYKVSDTLFQSQYMGDVMPCYGYHAWLDHFCQFPRKHKPLLS